MAESMAEIARQRAEQLMGQHGLGGQQAQPQQEATPQQSPEPTQQSAERFDAAPSQPSQTQPQTPEYQSQPAPETTPQQQQHQPPQQDYTQQHQQQPEQQPEQDITESAMYWRNRHDRAAHQLQQLGQRNQEMQQQINQLNQQMDQERQARQQAETERDQLRQQGAGQGQDMSGVPQSVIDEYGEDFARTMSQMIRAQIPQQQQTPAYQSPQQQAPEQPNANAGQQGNGQAEPEQFDYQQFDQQNDAEARFWTRLAQQVPDYEQVNVNAGFLSWLNRINPQTGLQRQKELDNAAAAADADAVARIFNTFKQGGGQPAPQQPNNGGIPPEQIQPQTVRSSQPEPQQDAPIWTREHISQFERDKRSGRLSPQDAKFWQGQLDRAVAEGRVR